MFDYFFPPENRAFYEIRWKNIVQSGRPQMAIWRMRIACWVPTTTNKHPEYVEVSWNMMAHAQKPDFVFRRNGRVNLNRRRRQFSRLLAAELCVSAVVMLDTPCSEVVWRVLATHSIYQFPLHFPSRVSPCVITFQLEFDTSCFSTTIMVTRTHLIVTLYVHCLLLQLHSLIQTMKYVVTYVFVGPCICSWEQIHTLIRRMSHGTALNVLCYCCASLSVWMARDAPAVYV